MSEIMEDIAYLSQEIGPRPAGTEEEQQASLYIADQMQKRTGFTANIEDFNTATQPGLVEAICFGLAAIVSLLAIIIGALAVPAFLVTLACAILYAFEIIDRPLLSHAFERGVSQNVVARYQPGATSERARGRKVILVANYDSGKVQPELNGGLFGMYPMLLKASSIALVALPVIWLFRMLFGGGAIFFNVLAAIALVLAMVRVALFFMYRASTYNEAANNNATGVATLLEVARIISEGTVSEEELAAMEAKRAHSAEEAFEAGVVPEGAELEYAEGVAQTEEERLASAKAAIAGITGKPLREYQVEKIEFTPMAERDDIELYNEDMDYGEYAYNEDEELTAQLPAVEIETAGEEVAEAPAEIAPEMTDEAAPEMAPEGLEAEAAPAVEAAEEGASEASGEATNMWAAAGFATPAPAPVVAPPSNEPEWYTTGRAKAVKPANLDSTPIRRSRYADALDAALASSSVHIEQAARMLDEGTIERISEMKRNIESRKLGAQINDAPLQDLLSDEAREEAEEAAEATAEEFEGTEASEAAETVETDEAAPALELETEAELEASAEGTAEAEATEAEAEAAEEEAAAKPAHAPLIDLNEAVEAPAQEVAPAGGETIAMPPINVHDLITEPAPGAAEGAAANVARGTASGEAEAARDHDFSQITAPAHRYRDIALASIEAEEDESTGPSRYSNPLQSERIPRIVTEEPNPISVMEEIKVAEQAEQAEREESIEEKRAALRNAIPSLSGEFSPVVVTEPKDEEENVEVAKAGSFATASAAAPFEPVGDELVADLKPEERYIEDADDSSFEENTTATGAYAGPDYVEIPESRLSRFFNRFRKKPEPEEESTNEWLDVDENYQAREVGAARGSWESFRQGAEDAFEKVEDAVEDAADKVEDAFEDAVDRVKDVFDGDDRDDRDDRRESTQDSLFDEYEYVDVDEEERSWHGGAFSQMRARLMGDAEAEEAASELVDEVEAEAADLTQAIEIEDAPVAERVSSVAVPLVDTTEEARIAEEAKMVYSFRNPEINTEVWFVALGSEYANNGGMKAFLAEHAAEMRGAIIVNLEAMGAGQLSFIEEEGLMLTQKPSSRLKRFLHKAAEVTGVATGRERIDWRESAASLAMKRGMQAFTLAGMEGGKPALLGQGDDVYENIDEEQVAENAQFIIEMIKNI